MSSLVQTIYNSPGEWDVYLSYDKSHPAAAAIAVDLYSSLKELGLTVWLDVKMDQKSEAATKEGVTNSVLVIAIITGVTPDGNVDNAYFNRPFCIKELEWAMEAEVPIQPVIRMEDKKEIGTFLGQAPDHLKYLGSIVFIGLNLSNKDYWQVDVNKITKALGRASQSTGNTPSQDNATDNNDRINDRDNDRNILQDEIDRNILQDEIERLELELKNNLTIMSIEDTTKIMKQIEEFKLILKQYIQNEIDTLESQLKQAHMNRSMQDTMTTIEKIENLKLVSWRTWQFHFETTAPIPDARITNSSSSSSTISSSISTTTLTTIPVPLTDRDNDRNTATSSTASSTSLPTSMSTSTSTSHNTGEYFFGLVIDFIDLFLYFLLILTLFSLL